MKSGIIKPALQAAAILALSAIAASITWGVAGPKEEPPCDPTTLDKGEICLESISSDKTVLWIDARSRKEWEKNGLPGSILWNFDASEDFNALEAEAVMKIFNNPYVVVYCGDKGCATSRKIAEHITDKLQLEAEVYTLHNGWKALKLAGKVSER